MTGETEFSDDITALYRLYDAEDVLLYVGITCRGLTVRMREHAASQPWWPEVARKTVTWYPDRDEASAAETEAIEQEEPKYNKVAGCYAHSGALPETEDWSDYELRQDLLARWDDSEFVEWGPGEWRRKLTKEHPLPWKWDGRIRMPMPPAGMGMFVAWRDGMEIAKFRAPRSPQQSYFR